MRKAFFHEAFLKSLKSEVVDQWESEVPTVQTFDSAGASFSRIAAKPNKSNFVYTTLA
jgi:hypothetical protein